MILTTPIHVMWAWLVRDLMAAYVQESELVSFFIYSPDLGRKEGTVSSELGLANYSYGSVKLKICTWCTE